MAKNVIQVFFPPPLKLNCFQNVCGYLGDVIISDFLSHESWNELE